MLFLTSTIKVGFTCRKRNTPRKAKQSIKDQTQNKGFDQHQRSAYDWQPPPVQEIQTKVAGIM